MSKVKYWRLELIIDGGLSSINTFGRSLAFYMCLPATSENRANTADPNSIYDLSRGYLGILYAFAIHARELRQGGNPWPPPHTSRRQNPDRIFLNVGDVATRVS